MSESVSGDWAAGWYCVRSKPRSENAAAHSLAALDEVDVFLPKAVPQHKRNAHSPHALFPGYLFAHFDPILNMRAVQYSHGVAYVVRRNLKPIPVPNQVIKDLDGITVDGVLEIPDQPHQVGDQVTIIAGLFKGCSGKVMRLVSTRERVKVLFEFLGRSTEVEIDEDALDFPKAHPMRMG